TGSITPDSTLRDRNRRSRAVRSVRFDPTPRMDVAVVAKVRRRVRPAALAAFTRKLVRRGPKPEGTDVTIVLAGDTALRRLNREFRAKDRTTDVLSFPSGGETLPDGTRPLGEIVISVAQAARQAAASGHGLERELRVLIIHG